MTGYLPDTNVWLALTISAHSHHPAAVAWSHEVEEPASIQFCRSTQQSYLRLLTLDAVFRPYGADPQTNAQAWETYQALIADDRVVEPRSEPAGASERWRAYSTRATASPKLWMDAYLAAYATSSGLVLVTSDSAFRQFSDLEFQFIAI